MNHLLTVALYLVVIGAYSLFITHVVPKRYYSLSNILIALGSIVYGRIAGLSLSQMGLTLHTLAKGLLITVLLILIIGLVLSFCYLVPPLKRLMSDAPGKRFSGPEALHELLLRIPFGTALSEEVLFRGVLLGMLLRDASQPTALIIAAIAFGLWHVVPTLQTVRANDAFKDLIGDSRHHYAMSVLTTVLTTGLAGFGFGWLRLLAGSILAPWIIHTFINGFSVGNAYIWLFIRRLREAEGQET